MFGYYAVRGAFFNVWRFLKRDRFNLPLPRCAEAAEAQGARRATSPRSGCSTTTGTSRLAEVPRERRVFLGLQLFPEASMDYWLKPHGMLAHDDVLVRYCEVLGDAGYRIFVKDHPLQFGFRQRELFERLSKLPFVTLVPYDVPANLLIGKCASVGDVHRDDRLSGGAGGTLLGRDRSILCDRTALRAYPQTSSEIDGLAERLARWRPPDDLAATRREIMRHLAAISVEGDYFGWRKFDPDNAGRTRRQSSRWRVR